MTTVHVSMSRDDGTGTLAALPGSLYWEPTTRREDGSVVVLPVGFAMNLVAGEAAKDVEPSGLTWCWRVTERVQDGTVRYVSVPDSAETVEYVDLPDVDPDTLVPWSPADPEAAYQAALDAIEVTGGVTSVDGLTGAVDLSGTYVAQFTQDDTPAAPAEGTSQTYFVTSAVSWPAGLEWSTDPDGGVAPTITGTALVSLFTYGGTTRAVLGATFPALPAEAVPPTAGTLGVVMGVTTADLTVTGAADETALAAAPYAFTMDGGVTWTAYQAGATYQYTSLTPSTSYTFQHRVIDLAGNVSTGVAVTDSTAADVTGPTAGTLAVVPTSTTATLTVSGASDDVALAAAPYAYSSDGGSTWTAYQAGDSYEFTGLTPSTSYDFRHKVKDAAGNETLGAIATTSTQATPSDTTPPTAGTLAGSGETSDGFTLTVTGAADETALDAAPYAFSTDNGSTYSAWQASNVYAATGLDASTGYTCVHKVRDAAGNVSTGSSITVTTTASTPATYSSTILGLSPAFYYPLDDTSGTPVDATGNTTATAYTLLPTLGATGLGDGDTSATFATVLDDPDAGLDVGQPSSLDNLEALSISAIVRLTVGNSGTGATAVCRSDGTTNGWLLRTSGTGLQFVHWIGGSPVIINAGTLNLGTAYHIGVIYNGATIKVYRDGVEVANAFASGSLGAPAVGHHIGTRGAGVGVWIGDLAGVAVFPTAITPTQMAELATLAGY